LARRLRISAPELRKRGWTEAMIRDLLGKPDPRVDNPHYSSAAPMRLWRLQKVEVAEALPEFAGRRERAVRQCAAAARAAEEDLEGTGRRLVPRQTAAKPLPLRGR
jgi:hypothetical protein